MILDLPLFLFPSVDVEFFSVSFLVSLSILFFSLFLSGQPVYSFFFVSPFRLFRLVSFVGKMERWVYMRLQFTLDATGPNDLEQGTMWNLRERKKKKEKRYLLLFLLVASSASLSLFGCSRHGISEVYDARAGARKPSKET